MTQEFFLSREGECVELTDVFLIFFSLKASETPLLQSASGNTRAVWLNPIGEQSIQTVFLHLAHCNIVR
jgi:hypothetical protein